MTKKEKTELYRRIVQLYNEGYPIWKIARLLNVSEYFVVKTLGLN